jgi:hypothetical protein
MARRRTASQELETNKRSVAAVDVVSQDSDALREEQRQIRAALVEYFAILQDWAQAIEKIDSRVGP